MAALNNQLGSQGLSIDESFTTPAEDKQKQYKIIAYIVIVATIVLLMLIVAMRKRIKASQFISFSLNFFFQL